MRRLPILIAAATLAALAAQPAAFASTEAKCEPDTLANTLHERMKADGKSNADIRDILGSSMKRRVVRGRVSDSSGCSSDQTEKALQKLEATVKQG